MTNKIKLTQKKELIKKKPKKTIGDDIMKINLDTAKRRVQNDTSHYIVGIKFVTTETPEIVLQTIKKDFMIYRDITRIIVHKNLIELAIGNATLYTFYFLKKEVFDEVVPKLKDFNVEVVKL